MILLVYAFRNQVCIILVHKRAETSSPGFIWFRLFFFNYYELSFMLLVENLIGMMVEIDNLSQDCCSKAVNND